MSSILLPSRTAVDRRDLDQLFADRVLDEAGSVVNIELPHEVVLVRVDRLDAQVEPGGEVLAGEPVGQELQHLTLAVGEKVVAGPGSLAAPARMFDHNRQGARAHVPLAAVDRLDGEQELRSRAVLEDVAGGPRGPTRRA